MGGAGAVAKSDSSYGLVLEVGDAGVVIFNHVAVGGGAGLLGGMEQFFLEFWRKFGPFGWGDADFLDGFGQLGGGGGGGGLFAAAGGTGSGAGVLPEPWKIPASCRGRR